MCSTTPTEPYAVRDSALPRERLWGVVWVALLLSLSACGTWDRLPPSTRLALALSDAEIANMAPGIVNQYSTIQQAVVAGLRQVPPLGTAGSWGKLGMWYHTYNYRENALACYEHAHTLAPQEARWSYYLGTLHFDAGRFDEARTRFQLVIKLQPGEVSALVYLGEIAANEGRTDLALSHFEDALQLSDKNFRALLGLGQLLFQQGNHTEAEDHLRRALRAQPKSTKAHYQLGLLLRSLGDKEGAEQHLSQTPQKRREAVRGQRESRYGKERRQLNIGPRTLKRRAKTLENSGRLIRAEHLLRKADMVQPDDPDTQRALGRVLLRQNKNDRAVRLLEKATEQFPEHARLHFQLGRAHLLSGDPGSARGAFVRTVELDPSHIRAHLQLGTLARKTGDRSAALQHLQTANRLDELGETRSSWWLAQELSELDRYEEARAVLKQRRTLNSLTSGEELLLFSLLTVPDDNAAELIQEGVRLAQKQFQQSPKLIWAVNTAYAYSRIGDFSKAIHHYRSAHDAAAANHLPQSALDYLQKQIQIAQTGELPERTVPAARHAWDDSFIAKGSNSDRF